MEHNDPDIDALKGNIREAIGVCTHKLEHLRAALEAEWPRVVRLAKDGTDWSAEDKRVIGDAILFTYYAITRDGWREDAETVAAITD